MGTFKIDGKDGKKRLNINSLPLIENILKDFGFFNYSTQKRNLAYQIQLFYLFVEIYQKYNINRGLGNIFIYQICCTAASIIEGMLFCSIRQSGIDLNQQGRHKKALGLINLAKSKGLINKDLAKRLQKIIDIRNDLHPERQKTLHAKEINDHYFEWVKDTIEKLKSQLENYFTSSNIESRQRRIGRKYMGKDKFLRDKDDCLYCQLIVKIGEVCPACGNFKIW